MNNLPKNASICYIQRKLKASYDDAKVIFDALQSVSVALQPYYKRMICVECLKIYDKPNLFCEGCVVGGERL